MFCQTSLQYLLKTQPINDKIKVEFLDNTENISVMIVGDNILVAAEEAEIDEHCCLLENQSTCNSFINQKYLSNTRDKPNKQYIRVHCNAGLTYTNKIGAFPG